MSALKFLQGVGVESKLYSDDVFASYVRTGTGADVTVTTGIDMTKGYMVWSKGRSGATDHAIYDSERGVTYDLVSNSTAAQTTQAQGLKSVSATGHTWGTLAKVNTSSATYVDWTFRKAPKFFDVVTYTGNGANLTIAHSLGQAPGMIIVKRTNGGGSDWAVYHRSNGATKYQILNLNNAAGTSIGYWNNTEPTSSVFSIGTNFSVSGGTYVAYLFAHDPSVDGIIQCGSYTGNGSATGPIVNLGWEPQYLMIKNASGPGNWQIIDNMRGMPVGSADATLQANLTNAESSADYASPTATGFQVTSTSSEVNTSGSTYIYLAIRRPNKPPTSGTEVFSLASGNTSGTNISAGFPSDAVITKGKSSGTWPVWLSRLTTGKRNYLHSDSTDAEASAASDIFFFDLQNQFKQSWGNDPSITYMFRRAPGFFDVVCYTGTGGARTVPHNLGVAPELIITKSRSGISNWYTLLSTTSNYVNLASTAAATTGAIQNIYGNGSVYIAPTIATYAVGPNFSSNATTYVSYLFSTKPGISKVGSYTGNGTTQTINCGFAAGARFVLIKRTDNTGDWYVWDSARGIIAGNDPHLSLNTTAAEVTTDDSVDPDNTGFIVNQLAATNINVTSAEYIFLAIS